MTPETKRTRAVKPPRQVELAGVQLFGTLSLRWVSLETRRELGDDPLARDRHETRLSTVRTEAPRHLVRRQGQRHQLRTAPSAPLAPERGPQSADPPRAPPPERGPPTHERGPHTPDRDPPPPSAIPRARGAPGRPRDARRGGVGAWAEPGAGARPKGGAGGAGRPASSPYHVAPPHVEAVSVHHGAVAATLLGHAERSRVRHPRRRRRAASHAGSSAPDGAPRGSRLVGTRPCVCAPAPGSQRGGAGGRAGASRGCAAGSRGAGSSSPCDRSQRVNTPTLSAQPAAETVIHQSSVCVFNLSLHFLKSGPF